MDEALARAQRMVLAVHPHYETAEDALAETTFGLSYAEGYFVEFCVHARDHIAMRFDLPAIKWHQRLLRGRNANDRRLHSLGEVSRWIEQFFKLSAADFDAALRRSSS